MGGGCGEDADGCFRMNGTMGKLGKMQETEYSNFVRVLFGLSSPSPVPNNLAGEGIKWVDPSLNDSQKHAIKFALASREMALIHGPPGVSNPESYIHLVRGLEAFMKLFIWDYRAFLEPPKARSSATEDIRKISLTIDRLAKLIP